MISGILIRRAVADIKTRPGSHIMTGLVVCLTMLILSFFLLLYYNARLFVDRFGSELGIIVFLKSDVPGTKIPEIYQRIAHLPGIKGVNYVSPEEAFKRLERYLSDEKEVLQGVSPTFIPPSFEIAVNRAVFNLDRIKALASQLKQWPEVAKVQYGQEWINRLQVFVGVAGKVVSVAGLLLLISAAFVVSNTIKLMVYARQEELEILRLVGATDAFIELPFLMEAAIQGLGGSLAALLILFGFHRYIYGAVEASRLFRDVGFRFLPWGYTVGLVAASVALCVGVTALAVRRFMRL